jgi:hypothetical protein
MARIKETVENLKEPNEKAPSSVGPGPSLFAFTIDASTGQIGGLEKVDGAGARRLLTDQDKASLQASRSWLTLESIVEQAFEAGIACVLGNGDDRDEAQELEDEAEVRRTLLRPLMERSRTMTLLHRGGLGQAILATALQQATTPHASEAEGAPEQQKSNVAVKPHQPGSPGPVPH